MSLYAVQMPLSSIRPKVWAVGPHLYARTSYPVQALTLFAFCRSLHVDGERRIVELETVRFWFGRTRQEIPFDRIAYIDTRHRSFGTRWGWTDGGLGRTNAWEKFTVGLVLKEPQKQVHLFAFSGDAAVKTGVTGVLFGGAPVVDSYGDQADHFAFFVDQLHGLLGVPIGPNEIPITDNLGLKYHCSVCKRPSIPGRDRCWTCGSPVEPVNPIAERVAP